MNKSIGSTQWNEYLETPRRSNKPVKLDQILAARIEAFMRTKKVKSAETA